MRDKNACWPRCKECAVCGRLEALRIGIEQAAAAVEELMGE